MTHVAELLGATRASACRSSSPGSRRTSDATASPSTPSRRSTTPRRSGATGSASCAYDGAYRETRCTSRSIVLKALTYEPTGGIVAAPTTSLPERIGGVRNWDYRYCWLRDATFTLLRAAERGLHRTRHRAWRHWLLRAVAGDPANAQILYGVGGERRIAECELAVAARLRGLAPGADRERRPRAVPARRLRRGDGCAAPGARPRPDRRRPRVVAAASAARVPRRRLGPARRGDLGGARAAPPLHALEGARLGRVRPGRRRLSSASACRAGRPLAQAARRDPREVCREAFSTRAQLVHAVLRLGRARRIDAADPARRLPARRRPACARHDRRRPAPAARDGFVERYRTDGTQRGRRAARRRRRVPAVLVLARRCAADGGA